MILGLLLDGAAEDKSFQSINSSTVVEIVNKISRNWKDDPRTLPWLKSRAQSLAPLVSSAAITEVTRGWKKDSDTLSWLKNIVEEKYTGIFGGVTATQEIARLWKDNPNTFSWLELQVRSNENITVRCAAVQELAKGWKDDPETLPILKVQVKQDDKYVRCAAVQELARGWKDDLSLFELWCDRTLKDPFERTHDFEKNPRQIALDVLVRQYPNHPKTTELLHDRVQNDTDEKFRAWATEQLNYLASVVI